MSLAAEFILKIFLREALNVLNSIDAYNLSKFKEGSNLAAHKYNFENEIAKFLVFQKLLIQTKL